MMAERGTDRVGEQAKVQGDEAATTDHVAASVRARRHVGTFLLAAATPAPPLPRAPAPGSHCQLPAARGAPTLRPAIYSLAAPTTRPATPRGARASAPAPV
ncbi:hypothetical protein GUJ93_ZPchr0010g8131 [Zizania palustris]|uniref:Uncharacterized protein n=1 Tax=Zizania palustris TaxID=103762 RepID=A0A8J6BF29_ZIZPA|nr:hypothetical protein GUJ93_ZPchr0010g8131 [Zizania palustris]